MVLPLFNFEVFGKQNNDRKIATLQHRRLRFGLKTKKKLSLDSTLLSRCTHMSAHCSFIQFLKQNNRIKIREPLFQFFFFTYILSQRENPSRWKTKIKRTLKNFKLFSTQPKGKGTENNCSQPSLLFPTLSYHLLICFGHVQFILKEREVTDRIPADVWRRENG